MHKQYLSGDNSTLNRSTSMINIQKVTLFYPRERVRDQQHITYPTIIPVIRS